MGIRALCTETPKPPPEPVQPKAAPAKKSAPEPVLKYTSAATPPPPAQRMLIKHGLCGVRNFSEPRLYMKGVYWNGKIH